jgi:hypothetical protein
MLTKSEVLGEKPPASVVEREPSIRKFVATVRGAHAASLMIDAAPLANLIAVAQELSSGAEIPRFDDGMSRAISLAAAKVVRQMKACNVRIVYIGWGIGESAVVAGLEADGGSSLDRQSRARNFISRTNARLERTFATAPDTLFILSAGDRGIDLDRQSRIPSSIRSDNVLVVGISDHNRRLIASSVIGSLVGARFPGVDLTGRTADNRLLKLSGGWLGATVAAARAAAILNQDPRIPIAQLKEEGCDLPLSLVACKVVCPNFKALAPIVMHDASVRAVVKTAKDHFNASAAPLHPQY